MVQAPDAKHGSENAAYYDKVDEAKTSILAHSEFQDMMTASPLVIDALAENSGFRAPFSKKRVRRRDG